MIFKTRSRPPRRGLNTILPTTYTSNNSLSGASCPAAAILHPRGGLSDDAEHSNGDFRMKALGQSASGRPLAKSGDYERALALIVEIGGDKQTREYLNELVAASAAHDEAREAAELATAEAKKCDAGAREAEDRARSERETLTAETADIQRQLARQRAEIERDRQLNAERARELDLLAAQLTPREAALKRAFAGYTGETT